MKYHIQTFGCQMNVYDTESLAGLLNRAGHESTENLEEAEMILLNTCSIREGAEERVRGRTGQLKQYKDIAKLKYLGICGCMAQKEGERLLEKIPYLDLVMGPGAIGSVSRLVDEMQSSKGPVLDLHGLEDDYDEVFPVSNDEVAYPRFVSVMKGCDKKCTFCVVPFTRGPERSRAPHIILQEVENLVKMGHKEVTLIGQTINAYQWNEIDFAKLLEMVDAVPGLERLRFTTSHPKDATQPMLRAMAELPSLCEQLHLPVQCGSNRILRRMKRLYTKEEYLDIISDYRRRFTGAEIPPSLTTDLIVGFPGETEEDFEMTLDLMREVRYDAAFMFKYSPRRSTAALKLDGQVDEFTKARRLDKLIKLQNEIARELSDAMVGKTVEVMVEQVHPEPQKGMTYGTRMRTGRIVMLPKEHGPFDIGDIVAVTITSAAYFTLYGDPVSKQVKTIVA
ncbi:MAG: tRNA (N6-isopentenyl adenosine(37)-C2)-methylthiotransferase MiaB [Candidatus Hinthialibacter antarcticus]|nr:tRNA (N6-isopentenyl adenosine(37)-C2)-methylthiotransferase MiaB [Candidatus Hinthialibacter antarcticus]